MWEPIENLLNWFGISRDSRVDWLDKTVQRVLRGASIEEIESTKCPYCGAPLTIRFESDGEWFYLLCSNRKYAHHSPRVSISNPPHGWESHVDRQLEPGEERRCFRPWGSYIDESGVIHVRTSWSTFDSHLCGYTEIQHDNNDAGLWKWILSGSHRNDGVITEEELESLRAEYSQSESNL